MEPFPFMYFRILTFFTREHATSHKKAKTIFCWLENRFLIPYF